MTKTEKLLRELIAIPSVNPSLVNGQSPYAGEARIGRFVADRARVAGLDIEMRPVARGRDNIVARLRPRRSPTATLLLAPHLDTVGANVLDESLFTPRRVQGRLYGRGACDTKGSVAAMLTALFELAASRSRPARTEVVFVGLMDEECHQLGSRAWVQSGDRADLAIVGEPTRLQVVTAHKGAVWLRLRTRGKAAHGARPELGQNAIHSMARVVDFLQTGYAAQLRRRRHPLLGCGTVNVGSIQGGRQPNIVPDECAITIDRRTLPGEKPSGVISDLKRQLKRRGIEIEVEPTQVGPCGPLETSPSLPWVKEFMRLAGQKQPAGVDYFSDASVLAAGGIPSIVWGPGDIAQAHTVDEWIELRQLERAKDLLVCFLKGLP